MLTACDTQNMLGFRDYTIILLLLDTGIRVAELCSLTLDNIYLDIREEAFIKVTGKGRKEREVGISFDVAQTLWKYVHRFRQPINKNEKRLLISRYGLPLTANGVEQLVRKVAKRAGISGARFSPHTFRHTFSIMFLKNGGNIYKLSLLLGHSSVVVTENYLKDFYSWDARQDQYKHSPVANLDIKKMRSGFKLKKLDGL
jgi:integrase/recombinase XerD